jgi:zinc finger protein
MKADKTKNTEPTVDKLDNQPCPICHNNTLTLMESESEVPYFGKLYIFSMECSSCSYKKADVEAEEQKEPTKWTIDIDSDKDMNIRIVKSSEATVKIPRIITITPGPASEGYITNVEGLLEKVKGSVETARDAEEEEEDRKKAKNLIKKITRIMWGKESCKIIIEDPSGNSAIISDKAVKSKL